MRPGFQQRPLCASSVGLWQASLLGKRNSRTNGVVLSDLPDRCGVISICWHRIFSIKQRAFKLEPLNRQGSLYTFFGGADSQKDTSNTYGSLDVHVQCFHRRPCRFLKSFCYWCRYGWQHNHPMVQILWPICLGVWTLQQQMSSWIYIYIFPGIFNPWKEAIGHPKSSLPIIIVYNFSRDLIRWADE